MAPSRASLLVLLAVLARIVGGNPVDPCVLPQSSVHAIPPLSNSKCELGNGTGHVPVYVNSAPDSSLQPPPLPRQAYLAHFVAETQRTNDLCLSFLPTGTRKAIPHLIQTYMRNYIAANIVYFVSGGLWCLAIYRNDYFLSPDKFPSRAAMWKQIAVSTRAMPLYVALPTLSEYMIEHGWTRVYARIDEVGLPLYLLYLAIYLVFVEFWIYWAHRGLHESKFLYKWLHATHHEYNKMSTISPFAGLAFHPLDGIIQASPHVAALFVVPAHFLTHGLLLFLEGVWTTNIHDAVDERVFPIMGAGYHVIHHTTYRHNYGHFTVWMDWMCGTLREPPRGAAAAGAPPPEKKAA